MFKIILILMLSLPFIAAGQGFELSLETSNNKAGFKVLELPALDTHLVLFSNNGYALGIVKIDESGNILSVKNVASSPSSEMMITNEGFTMGNIFHGAGPKYAKINTHDFEGTPITSASYYIGYDWDVLAYKLLGDTSLVYYAYQALPDVCQLVRISKTGQLIWKKTIPNDEGIWLVNDIELMDGNEMVFIVDVASSNIGKVVKFDQAGEIVWEIETPHQGYLGGHVNRFPNENSILLNYGGELFTKLSNDGEILWSTEIDHLYIGSYPKECLIPSEDNGFYAAGLFNYPVDSIGMVKITENGEVEWRRNYGPAVGKSMHGLLKDDDGNFFMIQYIDIDILDTFHTKIWVNKIASSGEVIWEWSKTFAGQTRITSTEVDSDGELNFLCAMLHPSPIASEYEYIYIKLDNNGVSYENFISGKLVFDQNESCAADIGEPPLSNWNLKVISPLPTYTTTFPDGSFTIATNSESVEVSAIIPNNCWTNCPDPVFAEFAIGTDTTNVTIVAQAVKDCPILVVDGSSPLLLRNFLNDYFISCENVGTVEAQNIKINVNLDPYFVFESSNSTATHLGGMKYSFDIGNLGIGSRKEIHLKVNLTNDSELGQEHCLSVVANADNLCNNVDNSTSHATECQPNVGAYDPNDKRAFSEGKLTERLIPADSTVEYQIRFQNTGTYTAFNVVIHDTISSLLNIESIKPGASSHPYRMELERNNIVKFIFENIMLPDSNANEPSSHGFVKFRIQHMPGLVPGDIIPNKAAIFFDFNEAVITNNLELEILNPVSIVHDLPNGQQLLVYPQPSKGSVVFELIDGDWSQPSRLKLMNILGQKIFDQSFIGNTHQVENLPVGHHFFHLWQNGKLMGSGRVLVVK